MATPVIFHTKVNHCARFMRQNSGLPIESINPLVGDLVRIYHDSAIAIHMKVLIRSWELTNGSMPVLLCELVDPVVYDVASELPLLREEAEKVFKSLA